MTLGEKLIMKAVSESDMDALKNLTSDFFLPEEHALFGMVIMHIRNFSQMPSVTAVCMDGLVAAAYNGNTAHLAEEVQDSKDYLFRELVIRAKLGVVSSQMSRLTAALGRKDIDAAHGVLASMSTGFTAFDQRSKFRTIEQAISSVQLSMQQNRFRTGLIGITTGWNCLDRQTNGFRAGDLNIVAGRPGMGKTFVLIEQFYQAALSGKRVVVSSLEMTIDEIMGRLMARRTGIGASKILSGKLTSWQQRVIEHHFEQMKEENNIMFIEDEMYGNMIDTERAVDSFQADALYVDAAYMIVPDTKYKMTEVERITKVVRDLKALARKYKIPVQATFQLNREVKTNSQSTPDLGNLYGADAIGQDASNVILLSYPEVSISDKRKCIVGKGRGSKTENFYINFKHEPLDLSETTGDEEEQENNDGEHTQTHGWS